MILQDGRAAILARRLVAEFAGTGLLVAVVVGSGIAVTRLTTDGALRLLVCSVMTGAGLAVLIVVFAPVGGAQFNPVVTVSDWLLACGTPRAYGAAEAATVIVCQVAGAIGGVALADAMFSEPAFSVSRTHRGGSGVLLGEAVATAGLLLVIVALTRTRRGQHVAWAAGAWIGAAYWFTSSTSFANPAVTVGRALTATYAGIAPSSVPAFIGAQVAGGALGAGLAVVLFPAPRKGAAAEEARPARLVG
jgi:glycerol uptake facilitator-like aquaporin